MIRKNMKLGITYTLTPVTSFCWRLQVEHKQVRPRIFVYAASLLAAFLLSLYLCTSKI